MVGGANVPGGRRGCRCGADLAILEAPVYRLRELPENLQIVDGKQSRWAAPQGEIFVYEDVG